MSLLSAHPYANRPAPAEAWLVEPLLPVGGSLNVYGKPKAGKSLAALGLAMAVADGHPSWLAFPIGLSGPVVYLQLDTPRSVWTQDIADVLEADADLTLDQLWIADREDAPFPFNILSQTSFQWLSQVASEVKPVLIIIDTWREAFEGDESLSHVAKAAYAAFVLASGGAALLFISHSRKGQWDAAGPSDPDEREEADLADGSRGSSYLSARVDGFLKVVAHNRHEGTFYWQSRRAPKSRLRVRREAPWLWRVNHDALDVAIDAALTDAGTTHSTAALARHIAGSNPRLVERTRSRLRRRRPVGAQSAGA